jgi:oligoendopeptidase F
MHVSLRPTVRSTLALIVAGVLVAAAAAQERDRASIPDQYKWNLADIYPDIAAWRAAKAKLEAELPKLRAYQGTLASSPRALADALEHIYRVRKELARLGVYAGALSDQDTRVAEAQGMRQEVQQLGAEFGAQVSYLEPEILRMGAPAIEKALAAEPRLGDYAFALRDIVRRAPHTLGDSEERILADAAPLANAPSNIHNILSNADFPYPSVTLGDGTTARIDQAGYSQLRRLPDRADREKVMSAFFEALGGFTGTFGATMNGSVQKSLFYAKARKYPSTLQMVLDGPNIPASVYSRLVDGVNRSLPSFHRYLKLRTRMMGVDRLHYYDLYAPLVASVDLKYSPEDAQREILAALAPLGSDYVSVVQRAFKERWIDLFPNEGKRSGAYSNGGAYDVHPYILMNYQGGYDDMSTLAHELGHTMHSYYSNQTQPYPLAGYPIFVAEVASTFNEALLIEHVLRQVKDPAARLSILGNYLENIKATVFRQTQFAEFELRMHEMAQKGQPLTGTALAKLYAEITRKYYGHDEGVCVVDDYIAHEWSYIPHFYREFYVFQYATSFTASLALAEKVMSGDEAAKARYLEFLSAGGSKYPVELLKNAGVDMTTDEPLDSTIRKMNEVMDEMEELLKTMPPLTRQ